ncbi:metallophosphoesterase family protein [Armatimonas sp.]|uniref:metallophosphoesterase family protein n=1 Tax=Armatimonas sp. TaxID=1872638 RepID=UPI003751BD77
MSEAKRLLTIGLVTDVHYADAFPRANRYYQESLTKLEEAACVLREEKVDIAVELGDLIDTRRKPDLVREREYLKRINMVFTAMAPERHYVFGNHCVTTLKKQEFLTIVGQKKSYYSLKRKGVHLIFLDACFRSDGVAYGEGAFEWTDTEIPAAQREWLKTTLKKASSPVVVFVHQRLDTPPGNHYTIKSAPEVRQILEQSKKVSVVFMGHSHHNAQIIINGIPYLTLAAMVEGSGPENSGYSALRVFDDGSFELEGFRKHSQHPAHGKRLQPTLTPEAL